MRVNQIPSSADFLEITLATNQLYSKQVCNRFHLYHFDLRLPVVKQRRYIKNFVWGNHKRSKGIMIKKRFIRMLV